LLENESDGSLLSLLKTRQWSTSLTACTSPTPKGYGFFDIKVQLTENGLDHTDEIAKLIFQYINLLRQKGPQQGIFEECREQSEKNFQFRDKEEPVDVVTMLTQKMMSFGLEDVLYAYELLIEWRPELISEALERLNPKNCRITIISQSFSDKCLSVEKWSGAKYHNEKIDENIIDEWINCGLNEHLHFPKSHSHASSVELLPFENIASQTPRIIIEKPWMKVWYKQDTEFRKPKTFIRIAFKNPIANESPLNTNLLHLFMRFYTDSIKENLYAAKKADSNLKLSDEKNGIVLNIEGYSDNVKIFLEALLGKFFGYEADEQRFDVIIGEYLKDLKNFELGEPNALAVNYFNILMHEHEWDRKALIDEMRSKQMLVVNQLPITLHNIVFFSNRHFKAEGIYCKFHIPTLCRVLCLWKCK
jgi:insulysin